MDTVNKVQALMRSKAYANDFKKYLASSPDDVCITGREGATISISAAGKELCGKYAITHPIDPADLIEAPGFLDTVFPAAWEVGRKSETHKMHYGPTVDGVLHVSIDLSRSLEEVEKHIGKLYHHYKTKGIRNKKTLVDCWKVYDLSIAGHSVVEITLEECALSEVPKHSAKEYKFYDARRKAVEEALSKAGKLIDQFDKGA